METEIKEKHMARKPLFNYKKRYHFPNGYGASVIRGKYTYGGEEDLFELAVLRGDSLCYDSGITEDVIGHLTPKEVAQLLKRIRALPLPKNS